MSGRSYLSIGDVLTLLRQEFPDVTISKIRFLESQGLVNPERTPSGYRKFYEHDVERLRWVLRQQREHFLPLKVIKDRLDEEPAHTAAPAAVVEAPAPTATGDGPTPTEPALVGPPAAAADGGLGLSGLEVATTHHPAATTRATTVPAGRVVHAAAAPAPSTGRTRRHAPAAAYAAPAADPGPPTAPAAAPVSGSAGDHRPGPGDAVGGNGTPTVGQGAPAAPPPASGAVGGASLTLEELATASGLDTAALRQLCEFGLLAPGTVAGVEYFDEQALTVARTASRFAQFGIEPRHLRLYKNAAEREAGFIEQVVVPLVRQRNPEARARAGETADELSRLGQQLRGALLRRLLDDLLRG